VLHAIRFDFDPVISPLGLNVRLETLALAGVILLALVIAGLMAGRRRARAQEMEPGSEATRLRRDDLILVAFGAVPGAVFGGRLGYGLIHLDYYLSDPAALLDPGKGSLSLTGALMLGTVTALAVARLVGAPLRVWLNLAALPLLLGLGLGKLTTALGGSGQGAFSDAPWATAYVGPGVWGSLSPADPAIPSQILEGGLVLLALAVVLLGPPLLRLQPALRPRPSVRLAPAREWSWLVGERRFLTAVVLWASIRLGVAFTWRDARVAGPFGADQLLLVALDAACLSVLLRRWLASRPAWLASWLSSCRSWLASRPAWLASRPAWLKAYRARRAAARAEAVSRRAAAKAEAESRRETGKAEVESRPEAAAAAAEYPRQERGSEVQVVPEQARVEPAEEARVEPAERPKPPKPRRTHKPRDSRKSKRKRPGSGS
jgi:prolipoprotein diacylglyceryltransferase